MFQALPKTVNFAEFQQPTISIYYLVEDEYQVNQFRGSDVLRQVASRLRIISPTFPELNLTAEQIFSSGRSLTK